MKRIKIVLLKSRINKRSKYEKRQKYVCEEKIKTHTFCIYLIKYSDSAKRFVKQLYFFSDIQLNEEFQFIHKKTIV